MEPTLKWINAKFGKNPELAKANEIAVKTGYNFADTTEVFTTHYTVKKAQIAPGKYRKITGNEATAHRLCGRVADCRTTVVLRFVSNHAGV